MIKKVNLQKAVDGIPKLFEYLEVGKLNHHILNVLQVENRTLDFHIHTKSPIRRSVLKINILRSA